MKAPVIALWVAAISVCVLGCNKQIPHEANPNVEGDIKAVLYRLLTEQPGLQAPVSTKVADDAFEVTWMITQGMPKTDTVYYAKIASIDIIYKRYYRVMIKYDGGQLRYRYITNSEESARQIVDVLFSLKQRALSAPPPGPEPQPPPEPEPPAAPGAPPGDLPS